MAHESTPQIVERGLCDRIRRIDHGVLHVSTGLALMVMVARVCVVGSVNADLTFTVDVFPRPGQTVLASSLSWAPGGKGGNQGVAAARAGASCSSSRHSVRTPAAEQCAPTCAPTRSASMEW